MLMSSKHIAGVEVQLNTFLTSALGGGEWLPSHTPAAVPLGKECSEPTHWSLGGPQRLC